MKQRFVKIMKTVLVFAGGIWVSGRTAGIFYSDGDNSYKTAIMAAIIYLASVMFYIHLDKKDKQ